MKVKFGLAYKCGAPWYRVAWGSPCFSNQTGTCLCTGVGKTIDNCYVFLRSYH